jgi:GNAT superfamily N-acetyltransferase
MFEFRPASLEDAAIITVQRNKMFREITLAQGQQPNEEAIKRATVNFLPWVRQELKAGSYLGLFAYIADSVVASAGLWLMPWPPHPKHPDIAGRAYLLNVYTEAPYRKQGLSRRLVTELIAEASLRGYSMVTLHTSAAGRTLYQQLGFVDMNEMVLMLDQSAG